METELPIPQYAEHDRFNVMVAEKAGIQIDFELCQMVLDTRPALHYEHLTNLLKFESTALSAPFSDSGLENLLNNSDPDGACRFSPYTLPQSVAEIIVDKLEPNERIKLSICSPSWLHFMKNDFLEVSKREWPVATRSRQILSELASAFGGAVIRPVYDWKQVYRYLENIKEEVDTSIAIHEQLMSITAFAHFSLITDYMDEDYNSFLSKTIDWISMSASIATRAVENLISGPRIAKTEKLVAILFSSYHRLVDEWIDSFIADLYSTHIVPIFREYSASKAPEDALETLISLNELFSKCRDFGAVLNAIIRPLNSLVMHYPLLHSLSCYNVKRSLSTALKHKLPEMFAPSLFEVVFACEALREENARHLSLLSEYFHIIEEPALATFVPVEEKRIFRVLKQVFVQTCDGARLLLFIRDVEQFQKLHLDLERAVRIGTKFFIDDTLDEEIEMPSLVMRSDLTHLIAFTELLAQGASLDADMQRIGHFSFLRPFLHEPRVLAALIISAREVGLEPLIEALNTNLNLIKAQEVQNENEQNFESASSSSSDSSSPETEEEFNEEVQSTVI